MKILILFVCFHFFCLTIDISYAQETEPIDSSRATLIKTEFKKRMNKTDFSESLFADSFVVEYFEPERPAGYQPVRIWEIDSTGYFYTIIEGSNGVCRFTVLLSFTPYGKRFKHLNINKGCDMDLGSSTSKSMEYRFLDDRTLEVIRRVEVVSDKTIIGKDGRLKDGHDFFGQEVDLTEYYNYYFLNKFGDIIPYKPHRLFPQTSYKYLAPEEIENYDLEELRIMRNEIFAEHGYIFKSIEMLKYFRELEWYRPRIEDATFISGKLTEIEKSNIELIKNREGRLRKLN